MHSRTSSPSAASARRMSAPAGAALCAALLTALLTFRWLVPTEGTAAGMTLWIAQLTFGVALLAAWLQMRDSQAPLRFDRIDLAVGLLVGGQMLSGLVLLLGTGEKRAAVNVMWEWASLGVLFLLLRQSLARLPGFRDALLQTTLAIVVALSGYGIWQHYVWYPQVSATVNAHLQELETLQTAPPAATRTEHTQRQLRIRELEQATADVPRKGPSRQLFLARLNDSTEPFGPFALTNTFAGLLLAGSILALQIRPAAAAPLWQTVVARGLLAAPVVLCLLLTKSRTAAVGLLAGLSVLALVRWLARPGRTTRGRLMLLTLPVVAALAVAASLAAGIFDREVLTEAPKSLRYRLEYWSSTLQMLRESPLVGVGPGNFRQHYLPHKLPASSEEIADPHNLILDLWASGGLLSLAGFLLLITFVTARILRPASEPIPPPSATAAPFWNPAVVGAAAAFLLTLPVTDLTSAPAAGVLLAMLAGWLAVAAVLHRWSGGITVGGTVAFAALAGLCVHLLGAGGISMPAITQTLLLLAAVSLPGSNVIPAGSATRGALSPSRRAAWTTAGAAAALFAGCLWSASLPVLQVGNLMAAGNELLTAGQPERAARMYQSAADTDPLAVEPAAALRDLRFRIWEQTAQQAARAGRSDAAALRRQFDLAISAGREVIRRDPHNYAHYAQLAAIHAGSAALTGPGEADDATRAVAYLDEALERYPHNAALRAEHARMLAAAGDADAAAAAAAEALKLDALNRQLGHVDKWLPDRTVTLLTELSVPSN